MYLKYQPRDQSRDAGIDEFQSKNPGTGKMLRDWQS